MKKIAIIGAGLTGLTTAFYLRKHGFDVTIYEKENRCGGVINTHYEHGFVYESGPNTGVLGNAEIAELFEDLKISDSLEIADNKAKKRLIWKANKWNALPSGPISAVTTPLFTFTDKINVLFEPFRKKGDNPHESLADLVSRRLGKSFLDYAIDPFIGGIYAGDPATLIPKYALPKLYQLEQNYGSFIKGAIAKKKENKTDRDKKATKDVFSVKGGLGHLVKELVMAIGLENIFIGNSNITIQKEGGSYIVNDDVYDYLITTCPATALPNILTFADKKEIETLTNINYAPTAQVIMGYTKWDGDDVMAFGGLVPSIEKRNVLGILFTSSFFKDRAPKGGVLLSTFIGGTRNKHFLDLSEEEIKDIAQEEVNLMLHPKNEEPTFIRVFKHTHAIPQYELSSKERFEMITKMENKYKGLIIGGNIANGIGMADRVKQGKDIADRLKDYES